LERLLFCIDIVFVARIVLGGRALVAQAVAGIRIIRGFAQTIFALIEIETWAWLPPVA